MNWIKFGILLIGYITVGLLPDAVKKSLQHVDINISEQTLSFLSNKSLYGKEFERGYTLLLFTMAILLYAFFWLLTKYYNLGKHARLMRIITYTFASLALLAFVPHNIQPYSWHNLAPSLQRFLHNVLAVVVFLSVPTLIMTFQVAILKRLPLIGITGICILGLVILIMAYLLLSNGLNGIAEIFFIDGISVWIIFVSVTTVLGRQQLEKARR
ncbi:DUF998 domain-containing protein [Maribellus sp. CM-23]|uniref:DUF998 domain-containing protein n=1 Tax=Maribellus sp. CM-23 TaxID=2781026 RepID=UPI001F45E7C4|nr:DUF998 domain-containing protein [Maribellus sp. CM-23]MCE4564137.1 DUF998 domain-containing protein [Maribellus sp. CM-23]